ncbi:polysaccharide pyruvyl transferase family protein [Sphingobacterium paludis]|uniref:Polysaccharide pyruvyl transferase n=1 Tax=Sphingobacterium paludis TaxID=1476465 RepID=A0A4R7D4D6_9SPHI|nr:polysaccharide pyruvyl transferase family protein [Sphingobacterium paludis]TDS13726.1 polysaccharide pyruvyl transferase [Sphingobacterium paludis]
MKILVENSTWNNVGDGWYQYSLYFLLKKLYPDSKVIMGEGPIKRSFRIRSEKQLSNALNLLDWQDADLHVFSGPMLKSLIADYGTKIKKIVESGKQYAFISVSGANEASTKQTLDDAKDFLKKYPPVFFSSRDSFTYNIFKDAVPNAYDGICTAFLVDLTLELDTFKMDKPFFVSSFYMENEPDFNVDPSTTLSIENLEVKHRKNKWGLPFKYARHLNYTLPQQAEVGGHQIVRLIQNLNTKFNHINFAMPNSFMSFNPITYLEVIKSAEFVVSDRVHACATSLACNKPARFLFDTPRAVIFDRLGFDYKSNKGIMYPNMDKIAEEKSKLEDKIKQYI